MTLFLYSFKNINEAVRNISYDEEERNDYTKNKHIHIGILTEKNDIKMIQQLFINEVKMQGSEGEAICSFKVFFCHCNIKYTFWQT